MKPFFPIVAVFTLIFMLIACGGGSDAPVLQAPILVSVPVTPPARDANDVNRIGYLHDGRARTINEAILWHDGEALTSKAVYKEMSQPDKDALLGFLKSL